MAFRRDPIKAAEADFASLTNRREGVLQRLADATTKADAAAVEQRRLLIETDGADAVALKKAGDACRKTADDRAALEDAARVLAEMIVEAQAKVAAERDRIERERISTERTALVDRIAAAVAAEDAAARALAKAHEDLRQAAYAGIDPDPLAGPETFIGSVTSLVLSTVFPLQFTPPVSCLDVLSGRFTMTTPADAAAPMIAALRARVEEIRTGSRAALLPDRPASAPQPVVVPEEPLFFLRSCGYRGAQGQWVDIEAGAWTVPSPVAARACELKVGFRPGTREAATINRLLAAEPAKSIEIEEATGEIRRMPPQAGGDAALVPARHRVDLGIDVSLWIATARKAAA